MFLLQLIFSVLIKWLYVIIFYQCTCHSNSANNFPVFPYYNQILDVECKLCTLKLKPATLRNSEKAFNHIYIFIHSPEF